MSTSPPLPTTPPNPDSHVRPQSMEPNTSAPPSPSRSDASAPRSLPPTNPAASRPPPLLPENQAGSRSTSAGAQRSSPPENDWIGGNRKRNPPTSTYSRKSSQRKRHQTAKSGGPGEDLDDGIVVTTATAARKDSAHSLAELGAVDDRASNRQAGDEGVVNPRLLTLAAHEHLDGEPSDVDATEDDEEIAVNMPVRTAPTRQRDANVDNTTPRQHSEGDVIDLTAEEDAPSETDAEHHITANQSLATSPAPELHECANSGFDTEIEDMRPGEEILAIVNEYGKEFDVHTKQRPTQVCRVAKDIFNAPAALDKWRQNHREKWDVLEILNEYKGHYKILWDCIEPGTDRLWVTWNSKRCGSKAAVAAWKANPKRDVIMAEYAAKIKAGEPPYEVDAEDEEDARGRWHGAQRPFVGSS